MAAAAWLVTGAQASGKSTVAARDEARRASTGKVAYRGSFTPAENDAHLAATTRGLGLWLDTSTQTPAETVAEILDRRAEALVR